MRKMPSPDNQMALTGLDPKGCQRMEDARAWVKAHPVEFGWYKDNARAECARTHDGGAPMSWKTKRVGVAECVMCFPEVPTKQRPKFDTKRFRTYTPDKTRHAEKSIKRQWEAAVGDRWKDFATEVRVFIEVQRPLAKSNPKYWAGRPDLMKPDADNLAKVICDSLNGLAYRDDCQITQLGVTFDPRTPYSDECLIRVRVEYHSEKYEKEAR